MATKYRVLIHHYLPAHPHLSTRCEGAIVADNEQAAARLAVTAYQDGLLFRIRGEVIEVESISMQPNKRS